MKFHKFASIGLLTYLLALGTTSTHAGGVGRLMYTRIPGNDVSALRASPKFPTKPDRSEFNTEFYASRNYTIANPGVFVAIPAVGTIYVSWGVPIEETGFISAGVPATLPVTDEYDVWPVGYLQGGNAVVAPMGYAENYGSFMRAYIEPPQTGDYVFFIWSDDQGEFWLSDSENPAGKKMIVNEPACCGVYYNRSQPIHLEKGKRYYSEALHKEGVGGDYIRIGWRLPDGTLQRPISTLHVQPFPVDPLNGYVGKDSAPAFVGAGTLVGPAYYNFVGTGQPRGTNVIEGQRVELSAIVEASGAATYQWSRNATPIPGATLSSLVIEHSTLGDSGAYTLEVRNALGTATSAPAIVSVIPDVSPALPVSAVTYGISDRVFVTFSKAVDPSSAGNKANYSVNNGVTVNAAVPRASNLVELATTPIPDGQQYLLTVNGVKDMAASPNTTVTVFPFVQADGFLAVRGFTEINGLVVSDLTNHFKFTSDTPDFLDMATSFEYPPFKDGGRLEHYGAQLRGYVTPPVTGHYVFFISADDAAYLYLSTDETPANKVKIASEAFASNKRTWMPSAGVGAELFPLNTIRQDWDFSTDRRVLNNGQTGPAEGSIYDNISDTYVNTDTTTATRSRPVLLEAGKKYYIEGLLKEEGGADHIEVAWQIPGRQPLKNGDPGISSEFLTPYGVTRDPIAITSGPQNQSVNEFQTALFSVQASGYPFHRYQWLRNGQPITDATNATLTLNPGRAENGTKISVKVMNGFSSQTSAEAVLSVVLDDQPPVILSAAILTGSKTLGVGFDDRVNAAGAEALANYALSGTAASIQKVQLRPDGKSAMVTLSQPITESDARISISGIKDQAGNATPGSTATIRLLAFQGLDLGNDRTRPIWPGLDFTTDGTGFDVTGGGRDLWDTADGFHFVHMPFTGPFDIAVRVQKMDLTHVWAKAGIMVRQDLTPESPMLYTITTPRNGVNLYFAGKRDGAGGGASEWGNSPDVPYPNAWIRLQRIGDNFWSFRSEDGINWTQIGTTTMPGFPETAFIGLAVAAIDRNSDSADPNRVEFRDLSIFTASAKLTTRISGKEMIVEWDAHYIGGQLQVADVLQDPDSNFATNWAPISGSELSNTWTILVDGSDTPPDPDPNNPAPPPPTKKFYRLFWP